MTIRSISRRLTEFRDKAACRIIGHATDPIDVYNCICFRCGLKWEDYQCPPRDDLWFWMTFYNWRGQFRLRAFKEWLRCPYCNGRFGKHDHDRCFPF